MINVDKIYEVTEDEGFKYSVVMDEDFTYINYMEQDSETLEWKVVETTEIPTNYAKVIGKVLVELGQNYPD